VLVDLRQRRRLHDAPSTRRSARGRAPQTGAMRDSRGRTVERRAKGAIGLRANRNGRAAFARQGQFARRCRARAPLHSCDDLHHGGTTWRSPAEA
jgi:hypothetical protein